MGDMFFSGDGLKFFVKIKIEWNRDVLPNSQNPELIFYGRF